MKCPKCQFENREDAQFCSECGHKFELSCPECGNSIRASSKFCDGCGCKLESPLEALDNVSETESPPFQPAVDIKPDDLYPIDGERKHVTVLFSDLTGYTAMSERLDPEDVKEITSRIFGEISKIVANYDGFIEKYAGDAVLVIFGVPQAHEDDPIRAIKAAREIHQLVGTISPEVEKKIGQPISMHTGIKTGLVVTGEVDMERGTHGIAGETINLASRLCNLANPGEIVVDVDTCRQVEGHFTCEYIETTTVKGKTDPVQVHKVLSQRGKPVTIHRLSGMRADLVGRKGELGELSEAFENLRAGKGRIFSIYGDAGTGKSRLVEEFKATLDLSEVQWLEGHAYAYSQNIPYFPMIDLLNRVFQIEEGDSSETVRGKLKSGIKQLIGNDEEKVKYLGDLYSLDYRQFEEVSPEFWKTRLQKAIQAILAALAKKAPTVFFLEDLHWADTSFVELLRRTCLEMRQPAVVLCAYRPIFSMFTSHQLSSLGKLYHEIRLQDLSLSDAQEMLESLLKTENIPSDLKRLVQSKAEGNPFYLEELVNNLIESGMLVRGDGTWKLMRPITESDISSSLHGLISGRLDRLETETKHILQEASVIGRAFLYEILNKVSQIKEDINRCLQSLERQDLIRTKAIQPELEYIFKHALTQEVAYNGLLKKERREIHERIGLVIEKLFKDRLSELSETLAYHFSHGHSVLKAVDYLMKSGEKNLKRYSVEESHQYYKKAFELLKEKSKKTSEENKLLIDILIKWAYAFLYRGDFKGLKDLLSPYEKIALSINDKAKIGMYLAWLGYALYNKGEIPEAYKILHKALKIGEETQNKKIIGFACTSLIWACKELGGFEEAISYGERAQEISKLFDMDRFLYSTSRAGIAHTYVYMAEFKKVFEIGKTLISYGQSHNDIRSEWWGQWLIGFGNLIKGDFLSATECGNKAIQLSIEPIFFNMSKFLFARIYVSEGKFDKAEQELKNIVAFCEKFGSSELGLPVHLLLGVVLIAQGHMSQGIQMIHDIQINCIKNQRKTTYALSEYFLGKIYLQIVERSGPKSITSLAKNFIFLIKNVPLAGKKAEEHFKNALEVSKEIGAKGYIAGVSLDLGILHKANKRIDKAREYISEAIKIMEECGAEGYLKQAKEVFRSLD